MKKAIFLLCISALYFRSVAQTPTNAILKLYNDGTNLYGELVNFS